MTISSALDAYLRRYRLSGRRGLPAVEMRVRKHVRPFFGERDAEALTEEDLVAYWEWRAACGVRNSTVRAELAALRRALKLARVRVPAMPEDLTPDAARVGFLEPADFERACAALPEALRGAFRFAYVTGWRLRSEVFQLKVSDVDFTGGWVCLRDSKNREGRRFPLDCLGLRDLCREHVERAAAAGSPWLFQRFDGKQVRWVYGAWRRACRETGVRAIPHDFRRSAARNMREAGIADEVIMQLCGWRSVTMLHRYLGRATERQLQAAGARLAQFLA